MDADQIRRDGVASWSDMMHRLHVESTVQTALRNNNTAMQERVEHLSARCLETMEDMTSKLGAAVATATAALREAAENP